MPKSNSTRWNLVGVYAVHARVSSSSSGDDETPTLAYKVQQQPATIPPPSLGPYAPFKDVHERVAEVQDGPRGEEEAERAMRVDESRGPELDLGDDAEHESDDCGGGKWSAGSRQLHGGG